VLDGLPTRQRRLVGKRTRPVVTEWRVVEDVSHEMLSVSISRLSVSVKALGLLLQFDSTF